MALPFDLSQAFTALSDNLARVARDPNYLNYIAEPKQLPFHTSRARKKLFIGGNRAGKTTAGICEGVGWATKRHKWRPEIRSYPYPTRGRVVVQDLDVLKKIAFNKFRQWVPTSDFVNGSWEESYSAGDRLLTFSNGSTIEFKTYEQDVQSHAGQSLHWMHFDEPPPKAIYDESLPRLLDTYDEFEGCGGLWMTYTPTSGIDWAYEEIYLPGLRDPEGSGIFVVHGSVDDNSHISQAAKDELFKNLSEDQIRIRRHGEYVQLSGMVFDEWGPDNIISPDELYDLWGPSLLPPPSWQIGWSIDHGLNNPTAIYWHAVNPLTQEVITFHERYMKGVLIEDHAKAIVQYERENGLRISYRTGDPAMGQKNAVTGTSILQEYSRRGIGIAVESVPKDPSIGIVKMRQYMKKNPKTGKPYWRIYNAPFLYDELRKLHWDKYASTKIAMDKNAKETVHKYRDHAFDSCKYWFTSRPDLFNPNQATNREPQPAPGSYLAAMMEVARPMTPWTPQGAMAGIIPARNPNVKTHWEVTEYYDDHGF